MLYMLSPVAPLPLRRSDRFGLVMFSFHTAEVLYTFFSNLYFQIPLVFLLFQLCKQDHADGHSYNATSL
jgi:hypothetical protein